MSEIDLQALAAEFPRASVSWRAQSMTAAGDRAMALCYIDARDVMERLDAVCGPENWQDRYEFHGSRTVCYLSLRINGEWITKADGAGDSDVEAEKGAISDALKRAAVKWGVARYLYAMPTPWVQCEHYEKGGKKYWKAWKEDPWSQVRLPKPAERSSEPRVAANPVVGNIGGEGGTPPSAGTRLREVEKALTQEQFDGFSAALQHARNLAEVKKVWEDIEALVPPNTQEREDWVVTIDARVAELKRATAKVPPEATLDKIAAGEDGFGK